MADKQCTDAELLDDLCDVPMLGHTPTYTEFREHSTHSSNKYVDRFGSWLDVLSEGRVTPQYLADQLDITRQYASERLKRFLEHDHVDRLAAGLYELTDDPRSGE